MPAGSVTSYDEKLAVPIRWWVQATMFLATIWIAFIVSTPAWAAWGATAICVGLTLMMFVNIGNARITVTGDVLHAGPAHIDVSLLGAAEVLDAEQTRNAAGREADARAYLLLRPYLKQSVRVTINDPRDPTPYWLLATRHPGQLAAVLSGDAVRRAESRQSPTSESTS